MRNVHPEVFLVARPQLDYDALAAYLSEVGGRAGSSASTGAS